MFVLVFMCVNGYTLTFFFSIFCCVLSFFIHGSLQALRYSYFYVGQALGTPQQILDQGRPQASQPLQPLQQQQQQQFRPAPPPQPPSQPQHQHHHPQPPQRPLQQIQPPSAPLYQRHSELIPDPSICTVRQQQLQQEEGERGLQTRFPFILDKSTHSQVSE